jgi:uncharacterized protein DUF6599
MRAIALASILTVLASLSALAALPASLPGWTAGTSQTVSAPQLNSVAGENAAVVREYGFLGAERRDYTRQNSHLAVTLWLMEDATGSYGLFTFLSDPEAVVSKQNGDFSASAPGHFLQQRGPYVMDVRGDGLTPAETNALAGSVPATKGREALLPPLPGYLPEPISIPRSEKYLIGPQAFGRVLQRIPSSAVHFEMGAEASLARYRVEGKDAQLLLISYPTPQMAAKMLREFQTLPALTDNSGGKTLFVERKGSLVAFVFDTPSIQATEKLLNSIQYETNFVWNEYVPSKKENVGGMMLAVFSLAGFVLLVSLFSGLAFGGLRLIVKKFVPVPIFDRPSNVEIIRLNLTDM